MMCLKHASVQLMVALFKLIAFLNVVCSNFIVSCFYLLFFVEVCRFSFTVDVCRLLSVVNFFFVSFFCCCFFWIISGLGIMITLLILQIWIEMNRIEVFNKP